MQRLLRLAPDPAAVVPLGLLSCAASYWLSLVTGAGWLFPVLSLAACLPLAAWRAPRALAAGPSLRGALPALLVIVALLALTVYRGNRVDGDGRFLLDVGEHVDTALHVGVTWELVAGYPPQVPGLAGVPMSYHVGSHLVRAAAARWAGIHPYDSLNRFDVTLWALALVLALRAAAAAAGLGAWAVRLAGFTPLLADLSWLPGLLLGSTFWAFKLGGNFVEALFYANSIAPALTMALVAVAALARAERGEGRAWTAVAVALAGGAAFLKVFTGAQLLAALGLAWLFARARREALPVAAGAALAVAALALGSLAPAGGEGVRVALVPFSPANPARLALGLPEAHGAALVGSGLAWLALSLGACALGLPGAWRALRTGAVPEAVLGGLALIGWPLALCVRITADPAFDESFYFLQASGLALWLFAAPVLEALAARSRLAFALVLALTLPATVEFVVRRTLQAPEPIAAEVVNAMAALRAASCPGDVVLTRPGVTFVPPVVVLAGRRVPLAEFVPYWRQFTTPERVAERDARVREFFRARSGDDAIAAARRLGARFVFYPGPPREARADERPGAPPARELRAQMQIDGLLEPVFVAPRAGVFRIVPLASRLPCR